MHTCVCPNGYTGTNCELPIPCLIPSNPCQNSGTCSNTADFLSYSCDCITAIDAFSDVAWTGPVCEIAIPCVNLNNPCQNSAPCSNSADFLTANCDCLLGTDPSSSGEVAWTGLICDVEIPCVNPINNPCNVVDTVATCSNNALFTDYRVVLQKCHENCKKWLKMTKQGQNLAF